MISNLKTSLHKATLFGGVKHSPVKNKCGQFTINSFYTEIYLSNSNLHNIISLNGSFKANPKLPTKVSVEGLLDCLLPLVI
uniref:Uncharacterized protein n=1 Tax=Anguilla anguilla TaxID=7936 RepID=A0A0E9WTE6_ANGAN